MSKQQHSASLQIVEENQDLIEITQNSFQIEIQQTNQFYHPQKNNDTFQLSMDENSLSFQIQQFKQESNPYKLLKQDIVISQIKLQTNKPLKEQQQKIKPIPIVQEQRKRKRKQIFQKYKQKGTQNLLASPELQPISNDLMNTFDQIFRIKSPEKVDKINSNDKKQNDDLKNRLVSGFKKKQSVTLITQNSIDYLPVTFVSQNKIQNKDEPLVGKLQARQSISEFEIPSNISNPKLIDPDSNVQIRSTNSFIIESQVNKISMIYPQEEEVSKDSSDLQTFLKSQIFKDQLLDATITRTDTTYKNIEISMVNPSMMMSQQLISPINKIINIEQRFGFGKKKSVDTITLIEAKEQNVEIKQEKNHEVFEEIKNKPDQLVKQQVLSYSENRIPIYLRQIRRLNTIYPNFILKSKKDKFQEQQNKAFKKLLDQFRKGLKFLQQINELAYERYTVLTSLQKVLLNQLTVQNFLSSKWQIIYTLKQLENLKPQQNFIKRKYEYQKVKGALNNYQYILSYYQNCNFNFSNQKTQKKYLDIRAKFWQIQKNIKMIGQDIYLLSIQQIFPPHYYEYLTILKNPHPLSTNLKQINYNKKMLAKYYNLRQSGDLLSLSEIGKCVKSKLEKNLHKLIVI